MNYFMEKKFLMMAAAAAMFAACSNESDPVQQAQEVAKAAEQVAQQIPVQFDAYMNRATTRTETTTSSLQASTSGFGVFGYYTDNVHYDQAALPNFFYNQKVTYASVSSAWEYNPVKYWPNEFTDAEADETDRISFFAYGPYVEVVPATGKLSSSTADTGITGLSRNSKSGDPLVKYVVSFDATDANPVDLVWGVTMTTNEWSDAADETQGTEGLPWLDVRRPATTSTAKDQKLKFNFIHALASLNVKIKAGGDFTQTGTNGEDKTKIFVRSISFEGLATKGSLNLNNTVPSQALWYDYSGSGEIVPEVVTIYDGLKDGSEGTFAEASNEKLRGLNTAIIQKDNTATGVTTTEVNLFASSTADDVVYVIPTGEELSVTIVYDVETADANLATFLSDGKTHGSKITNRITKVVKDNQATPSSIMLENNKKYVITLILGMNDVDFEAEVESFDTTEVTGSADLPKQER